MPGPGPLFFTLPALLAALAACLLLGLLVLSPRAHAQSNTLPGFTDKGLAPLPGAPNAVSSQADDASRRVEPLHLPPGEGLDPARERATAALEALPGCRVRHAEAERVHAVCASRVFGFKDDVSLLLDAEAGLLHFRSASRLGYWDLGVNRRRYERFRELFQAGP